MKTGLFLLFKLRQRKRSRNLNTLKKLAEEDVIKAVIDRRFPLDQIAEAHKYVETGRKKGNVVITVVNQEER